MWFSILLNWCLSNILWSLNDGPITSWAGHWISTMSAWCATVPPHVAVLCWRKVPLLKQKSTGAPVKWMAVLRKLQHRSVWPLSLSLHRCANRGNFLKCCEVILNKWLFFPHLLTGITQSYAIWKVVQWLPVRQVYQFGGYCTLKIKYT